MLRKSTYLLMLFIFASSCMLNNSKVIKKRKDVLSFISKQSRISLPGSIYSEDIGQTTHAINTLCSQNCHGCGENWIKKCLVIDHKTGKKIYEFQNKSFNKSKKNIRSLSLNLIFSEPDLSDTGFSRPRFKSKEQVGILKIEYVLD